MNQILLTHSILKKKNLKIKRLKIIFFSSLVLMISLFFYYIYTYFILSTNENISSHILSSFNIQKLYSNNTPYSSINSNIENDYYVIGNIQIDSIDINYPILSNTNDELLKIAPCRFYGPLPNEIGNLCIAGHNYDDTRFFSNLNKLNINDEIRIYDLNNKIINYFVYDKYEIDEKDSSCTNQNTNGIREVTLVTCNNTNGNRLIIKAKENKGYF